MLHVSSTHQLDRRLRLLLSIAMLVALLGALSTPAPGLAQDSADPIISLSSADASACSDDENASCETKFLTIDFTHTVSYEFDCHGSPVHVPWFKALAALLGIDIPWWIPDPTPDSAICTYLAQGSTFKVYESGRSNPIVDKTYTGWKQEGQFTVQPNHTYELKLNGHGRDFRKIMEANGLTFDSFANVTYQEIDPNDDICRNAIPFDLPYSGNLEFSGDHDWQRIQSPVKGTMVLTLDVPPDKDYQLEVWNDACSAIWVLSQNGTGVDEQFVMPVDPVYYRVHVYGKTPDDFGAGYSVSALWDLDDNQWENAAYFNMPFEGNLEFSGDHDWQQINAPAGKTSLVLDVPEGKNYDLELWQDDAKIQLAASTNGAGVDETLPLTQPGLYRIHIYGVRASDFNAPYHVFLEGTGPVTLVRDLAEGSPSSSLSELTSVTGTLYFVADNVLWKSDGTEHGTVKVVASGGSFSHPHGLTDLNGKLYFAASPGEDIWVSDGTRDGTMRLGLTAGYTGNISELTNVNGDLYFVVFDCGSGFPCNILMNQNGEVFKEFDNPGHFPLFTNLTNVDGTLYFVFSDYRGIPTNPPTPPKLFWQLMKVTGSDEDPVVVGDIPGDESNPPGNFHAAGGSLYFVANDGIHGTKLWRSDGATIEMVPAVPGTIPQIGGAFGAPQEITNIGEDVFFTDGRALWIIVDTGNAEGIFCYSLTTSCVGSLGQLKNVDGTLYFVHSWENGTTLLRHDSNGTSGVKVFPVRTPPPPPPFVPILSHLTNVNGTLFFSVDDGINGAELWKSDGTEESTTMVADIAPGSASSDPSELTNVNGTLFFAANDGVHGNELWRTVDSTPPPSHLTVTSNADSGPGTLRWAIANLAPGGTIDFAFAQPTTIHLTSEELVVDKAMTINGPGVHELSISGENHARVFNVKSGADLEINTLTIANGQVHRSSSQQEVEVGGAIRNQGTLTISGSVLKENEADYGGAIHNSGVLTITGSVITDNTAADLGGGGDGGGIYNDGQLTMRNTAVIGNRAHGGGGILNWGTGKVELETVEVSGNFASNGGGIENGAQGTVIVGNNSTIAGNSATFIGGGIYNLGGTVTINDSTLSLNTANAGGGVYNENGTVVLNQATISSNTAQVVGGILQESGGLIVNNSSINNNVATQFFVTGGGGIRNGPASILTITNSTISNNTTNNLGGSGIENFGTLTLTNATITGNSGSPDSPGFRNLGTASLRDSLIAGNAGPSVIGQDCDGTLNSQGYNLIQDTTRCIIIGDTTGNLLGVDPLLGPLKDNGGPTFTHALLPGSPAINAIDQGVCPPPDTDQRGVSRPQGQKCDIGAYEALNSPPTASANGPYTTDEGSIVTLDATSSTDPDGDPLTHAWDLNNDGEYNDAAGAIVETSFPDDGQFPVAVRVTDPAGAQSTDSAMVNVLNVAPAITNGINTTGKPALINTSLGFSAAFTDPGQLDTHTALWDWGDGTTSPGLVNDYNVTGSHAYQKAGLYIVTLSIADDDGGSAAASYQYVVVTDPKAGFVTGGGWFRTSNKIAHFGFIVHYPPKGTGSPAGSVVFQVPATRLMFHSTRFDWMVINDSKVMIQGAGMVNGKGIYKFLLTTIDGSPDKLRIKIWDKATGDVIYDNQPGASDTADPTTAIKGGSIVIHTRK